MPPAVLYLKSRFAAAAADRSRTFRFALLLAIHLAALAILIGTRENEPAKQAAFLLTWAVLNFLFLVALRRPTTSAALSLAMIVLLVVGSAFKDRITGMTATFVDVALIDISTFTFLFKVIPGLAWKVVLLVAVFLAVLMLLCRFELFHLRRRVALLGFLLSMAGLVGLSLAVPLDREDEFNSAQYVSKFVRSGVVAIDEFLTRGVFEADAAVSGQLEADGAAACPAASKLPHIVMVFDESSFDATMMPGVKVPANYRAHFRSFDGKNRALVVEGAGGPSWFTEYNVLAGLSVRSYGRFADSVTRIATGRVKRGLPFALRRCGYKTYSLYSWLGAFLGARGFQTSTGIEHFLDAKQLRLNGVDTDAIFYDRAAGVLAQERGTGPVFVFVYLSANHFSWDYRYRPDLLREWKDPGNPGDIDEYLRRQQLSANDFAGFKERLARVFPGERFLLVRFGDHQPSFARNYLEPALDDAAVARRIQHFDPRYFTTYYALDTINFEPRDLASALDTLDAPYLPLALLEAAGVPLDASFKEQKRILQRCNGVFYFCGEGAEARRFNRLLINAGLLKF